MNWLIVVSEISFSGNPSEDGFWYSSEYSKVCFELPEILSGCSKPLPLTGEKITPKS
ncbi:hypothetical protein IR148_13235 [Dysgonomonas mossii]|uniref:hypothetical protein n=1 Tax=Dysgonomonas mossii TaxID=163665 RepID=UPI001431E74A|nr:hypothetical protein [Dysgonomonas mossii]MBF0762002.1 hypothetical protein [Dysgonomonas mossii]